MHDTFGSLQYDRQIVFAEGAIQPLPEYAEVVEALRMGTHPDGFIYPPFVVTKQLTRPMADRSDEKAWAEVPGSQRPAPLFRLLPTHELRLSRDPLGGKFRENTGGFLLHLLAYLFGARLQFHDWWVDGRIPTKSMNDFVIPHERVEAAITAGLSSWSSWPDETRRLTTNLLYVNSRIMSHSWDWEQFVLAYMVCDACYRLAVSVHGVADRVPHARRIAAMCERFGIPRDDSRIEKIVDLRNGMFHEALWDGSQPGKDVSHPAHMALWQLRKLNNRLIAAVLGLQANFITEPWWSFSQHLF